MYKYETHRDSPNFTKSSDSVRIFGHKRMVTGITFHHWGDPALNPSFNGVVDRLCNPASRVSAHYVVETGRVSCLVDLKDVAWHAGNNIGNATTVGIEANPRASKGDIETAAELIADIRAHYGDITIYAHNYWVSTLCPGRYDVHYLDRRSYEILKSKHGIVFN